MKAFVNLLTLCAALVTASTGFGQSVTVYDNQVSLVNNGRVNDPDFPVFLMHADSFSLSTNAVINQVSWLGAYKGEAPEGDDFTIYIFGFESGIPSTTPLAVTQVDVVDRQPTSQTLIYDHPVFSYSARVPDVGLPQGTYLIAIMNDPLGSSDWMWADAEGAPGTSYLMIGGAGTPWRRASGGGVAEFAFALSYFQAPDTTPPVIQNIDTSAQVLWPPNGRVVPVELNVTAVDNEDPAPVSRIIEILSNEPEATSISDWEITGPLSVNLRATRSGSRAGRTYTIVVECEDASGNVSSASVDVTVPHDRRR